MASNRVNQIAGHLNYPKGMLAGQVAIITGSGQGIGAEAAKLFANEGAKVVVADVDASKSLQAVARVQQTYLTQRREGPIRRRRDQAKRRQRHRSHRRRPRRCIHQDLD
jgi:NAD(P)-dependent dehydrogenase (short-subunit alcohol dehydrogenase family)